MEYYKEISITTIQEKINNMRVKQATDPRFGVKKTKAKKGKSSAGFTSDEEKAEFAEWKKAQEDGGE